MNVNLSKVHFFFAGSGVLKTLCQPDWFNNQQIQSGHNLVMIRIPKIDVIYICTSRTHFINPCLDGFQFERLVTKDMDGSHRSYKTEYKESVQMHITKFQDNIILFRGEVDAKRKDDYVEIKCTYKPQHENRNGLISQLITSGSSLLCYGKRVQTCDGDKNVSVQTKRFNEVFKEYDAKPHFDFKAMEHRLEKIFR